MTIETQTLTVQLSNTSIQVRLRESVRSSRLSLKLNPTDNVFYLTMPPFARQRDVVNFIEKSRPWLENMSSNQNQAVPFAHNSVIPILGEHHQIIYAYADMPQIHQKEGALEVKGFDPIIIPGLVKDWLRSTIYRHLSDTCQLYAEQIQQRICSINVKDTSSRWGSCSKDGNLSFSWRLVFAPESVVRYVCAHEVAHLQEMNHSSAFWQVVENLYSDYAHHRAWLKKHGKNLFQYGQG